MNRSLRSLLVGCGALVSLASPAPAQDPDPRGGQLDLGIYVGGAYESDWFTTPTMDGDEGWGVGPVPVIGLTATYWLRPTLGVRLHGAYAPSSLPQASGFELGSSWAVNNWLYDLDVLYRPWASSGESLWQGSGYFFLGAGVYTTDPSGSADEDPCLPLGAWVANGVCVPGDGGYGSVAQGVLGGGADFARVGRRGTLFAELAIHFFDSPVHTAAPAGDAPGGDDSFTVMPRLVLGAKVRAN
jgi:hypothetical protein